MVLRTVPNGHYSALLSSAFIQSQYDFGQRFYGMTVHEMYDGEIDEGIGLTRMADDNMLQYGDVF